MSKALSVMVVAWIAIFAVPPTWGGYALYMNVPDIPGPGAPQKFPTSIQINSFSMSPNAHEYTVTRPADALSTTFLNDSAADADLKSIDMLYYKTANEQHDPYFDIHFVDSLVSGYSISGTGPFKDTIEFDFLKSTTMYLKLGSGPLGESSPPGNPNVIHLNSFSLDGTGLNINKDIDSTSPALAAAVANGAEFSTGELLFYDLPVGSNAPTDPPTSVITFSNLIPSSYQTIPGAVDTEQVSFNFTDVGQTPEPGAGALVAIAVGAAALRRKWH